MGSQKPKLKTPVTYEGLKENLNYEHEEQCAEFYEALWQHYGLEGRIGLIISDLNEAELSVAITAELLHGYLIMLDKILIKLITADLIHAYAKCIKRNNTNAYISNWAQEVAYIIVERKHDELPVPSGVDIIITVKAIKACFSYLKDGLIDRIIEDAEDFL